MAPPKITLSLVPGSAHLQPQELDRNNCLSSREGEPCFPLKATPGLAVDYTNQRVRVENLSREEGRRFLTYFADHAEDLQIDREEEWTCLEVERGGEKKTVWIEIGKDEIKDGVRTDVVALSDAQSELETEGWKTVVHCSDHIHPKYRDFLARDIYRFSAEDLDNVTDLAPLRRLRFSYAAEKGVVTPIGVYALRLNEQNWESREEYYDRFQKGIEWFIKNEEELVARCFTPGRDLVEASGCFALGADALMAAHASPVSISFTPLGQ